MAVAQRYDRQARVEGWDQDRLSGSRLTIVGHSTFSEYLSLAAAALGVGKIRLIATPYDIKGPQAPYLGLSKKASRKERLSEMTSKFGAELEYMKAHMKTRAEDYFLLDSDMIVDASMRHDARALCMSYAAHAKKPSESVIFYGRGLSFISIGKESPFVSYGVNAEGADAISAMIAAGAVLEEAKKGMFGADSTRDLMRYAMMNGAPMQKDYSGMRALVAGAGALGNFVAPGLASLGASVDILDPDTIEETNLNRQIAFYGAVGDQKANVLAERCREMANAECNGIAGIFDRSTRLAGYDAVFDCVDNFRSRIIMSEKCAEQGVPLISGGTSYRAGQAIAFLPKKTTCPKHALDMEKIEKGREAEKQAAGRARCIEEPDPSVIMSNMATAGMMLNEFRKIFAGDAGKSDNSMKRYDATGMTRFGKINLGKPCGD